MSKGRIGVIGATSHVGESLLELLVRQGWEVVAFSRSVAEEPKVKSGTSVSWRKLEAPAQADSGSQAQAMGNVPKDAQITNWISLAPIVTLADYLPMLAAYGARRVVALSSTSRFTKTTSSDPAERAWVEQLVAAEEHLIEWSRARGVEWVILRPTLIYGLGRDRNIAVIASFIRRFGFFPLVGKGEGLRQPVHARDVAQACYETLVSPVPNRAYTISGAETLTYRDMVDRVFRALDRRARFLVVPVSVFRVAFLLLRLIPRFRYLSVAMVERMNRDLAFDHAEATRDFGFSPSGFKLEQGDLPR